MTITGDSRVLENVEGVHLADNTIDDVNYLWVQNQELPFIPSNIDSFFKNIIALNWHNSSLASLSASDFEPFPELQLFAAGYNNLVTIDGDLFKHTPKLILINFGSNKIRHVGRDLIKGMENLRYFYFQANPCVNLYATDVIDAVKLADKLPILCPPLKTGTISTTANYEL